MVVGDIRNPAHHLGQLGLECPGAIFVDARIDLQVDEGLPDSPVLADG